MKKHLLLFLFVLLSVFGVQRANSQAGPTLSSWSAVTATGTTSPVGFKNGPTPSNFSITYTVNGTAPSACTFRVEGSNDYATWSTISATSVSCTASGALSITNTPTVYLRINVLTYTGTSGFVVFTQSNSATGNGNGGSMTWPTSAGYVLYCGSQTWCAGHLSDNGSLISFSLPASVPSVQVGSAGTPTQLSATASPISTLPAASTVPPATNGSTTTYTVRYVPDGLTPTDCGTGGGNYLHWCYSNGVNWIAANTSGTVTTISVVAANGFSCSIATATSTPTLTCSLGAITPSSMIASGISDGQAPVTITTGASASLGGTYSSGYTINENATAATAVTYTLPTAAQGKQYCITNGNNASAANTGALTLQTSAAGQYIIFTDGTLSASGGYVLSNGAARDAACVVGQDATHWVLYTQSGTWTKH